MKLPQLFLTVAAFFIIENAAAVSVLQNTVTFNDDKGVEHSITLTNQELFNAFAPATNSENLNGLLSGASYNGIVERGYKVTVTYEGYNARNYARDRYIEKKAADQNDKCRPSDVFLVNCTPPFSFGAVIARSPHGALSYQHLNASQDVRVVIRYGQALAFDGNSVMNSIQASDLSYALLFLGERPTLTGSWWAVGGCGTRSYGSAIEKDCSDNWNSDVGASLRGGMEWAFVTGPNHPTLETLLAAHIVSLAVDPVPLPNPVAPSDGSGSGSTTGSGSNVVNNYNNECTKPDGSKSTNQFDCTPIDSGSNCNLLDIPCNLKWLFIPDPEHIKVMFALDGLQKTLHLPIQSVDYWEFELYIGDTKQTFRLPFNLFVIPDKVKTFIDALIGIAITSWVLNYLGLPNPLGRSSGGSDVVSDSIEYGRMGLVKSGNIKSRRKK